MSNFRQVDIEEVKNFWDKRPCNINHSPKTEGTREYFDEVECRKYFVEPHIPKFAQFERWKDKRILEIGCGIGTDTINFARAGAFVTAVELSGRSLEIAKRRAEIYSLKNRIKFYCGNAEELSAFVPIEPYDLIYSFGVIHHTPRPELILKQMRNYVHPGSTVKLMVYHRCSWKTFYILFNYGKCRIWRLPEFIARYSEAQTGCPVTHTFSRRQIKEMIEQYGFKVNEMRVEHIFPYSISEYLQHRYLKVWYFSWMPHSFFQWLERHFGWHLCVTAKA